MQSLTERSLNENFARGEGVENVKSHTSLLRSSLNPTRLGGEVRNAKHSTTRHISNISGEAGIWRTSEVS